MKTEKRNKIIAVFCALFLAAMALCIYFACEKNGIYKKTLRLHVIAESDSDADQTVKLAVRDAILNEYAKTLTNMSSKDDAAKFILENREAIKNCADKTLESFGADYRSTVEITKEIYPERTYGDVTLPMGEYTSVKIKLGKAEGHNWWCVLFPPLCRGAATAEYDEEEAVLKSGGFSKGQISLVLKDERKIQIKFGIWEFIKKTFDKLVKN